MVRLATVRSTFHARVIAARLGAEGIMVQLRGNVDGVYPMGDTHVYVEAGSLETAREVLLVDEVESAFDEPVEETAVPTLTWSAANPITGNSNAAHERKLPAKR